MQPVQVCRCAAPAAEPGTLATACTGRPDGMQQLLMRALPAGASQAAACCLARGGPGRGGLLGWRLPPAPGCARDPTSLAGTATSTQGTCGSHPRAASNSGGWSQRSPGAAAAAVAVPCHAMHGRARAAARRTGAWAACVLCCAARTCPVTHFHGAGSGIAPARGSPSPARHFIVVGAVGQPVPQHSVPLGEEVLLEKGRQLWGQGGGWQGAGWAEASGLLVSVHQQRPPQRALGGGSSSSAASPQAPRTCPSGITSCQASTQLKGSSSWCSGLMTSSCIDGWHSGGSAGRQRWVPPSRRRPRCERDESGSRRPLHPTPPMAWAPPLWRKGWLQHATPDTPSSSRHARPTSQRVTNTGRGGQPRGWHAPPAPTPTCSANASLGTMLRASSCSQSFRSNTCSGGGRALGVSTCGSTRRTQSSAQRTPRRVEAGGLARTPAHPSRPQAAAAGPGKPAAPPGC